MTLTNTDREVLFDYWYGRLDYNEETATALTHLKSLGLLDSKEVWVPIKGYEDLYEVSTCGRIRNSSGLIRKTATKNNSGYIQINLSKNGVRKRYLLHRLVASSFLDNPSGLPEVNHMDEDKENNCLWNLEWCSRKYNNLYGEGIERAKANRRRVHEKIPVAQYLGEELIKVYESVNEASRETGICAGCISRVINGQRKTTGGYRWIKDYESGKKGA